MSVTEILKIQVDTKQAEADARRFSRTWDDEMGKAYEATEKTSKSLKGIDQGFNDVLGKLAPVALGAAAVTKAFDLMAATIRASISAALEHDAGFQRLAATYRADYGPQAEKVAARTLEQVDALRALTNVSDDTIMSMVSMGRSMGLTTDQAMKYTQAAIGLANATGRDVNDALGALIRTQTGHLDRTLLAIPALAELSEAELRAGDAVSVLNEEFSEQQKMLTQGVSGASTGLGNAWDELTEAMGRNFTESGPAEEGVRLLTRALEGLTNQLDPDKGGLLNFLPGVGQAISSIRLATDMLFPEPQAGDLFGGAPEIAPDAPGMSREAYDKDLKARLSKLRGTRIKKREAPDEVASGAEFLAFSRADVMGQLRLEQGEHRKEFGDKLGDVIEDDLKAQQSFNDKKLELEQRYQDGLNDIVMGNLQMRAEIEDKAAQEHMATMEKWTSFGAGVVSDFASTAIDALVDFANGGQVAFDQVLKGFLESTGKQIIGQGIANIALGTSRIAASYGADPTGYALVTEGGILTGVGAAMIGGSLLIPPSNGASGSPSGVSGGAGGAGGSIAGASSGGASTHEVRREYTINVFGKPTAELGRFLRDAEREASIRGLG